MVRTGSCADISRAAVSALTMFAAVAMDEFTNPRFTASMKMGPSRCDFRASHNYGIRSAFSPCRGSAQELVHRTIARCTCRGADLAGWFMGDWGSMGAALGSSWRAIPVCPPGRGCTRIDWANPDGGIQVGGLGTSSLRFGSVCGHRSCGRLLVAALSDEAHSQGTHVGVYSGTACPRDRHSVLGRLAGAASAGGRLCLQGAAGTQ